MAGGCSVKPVAAATPPAPVILLDVDEEELMRCLVKGAGSSQIKVTVQDFGGQFKFKILHEILMTQNGCYLVVFNMEWLLLSEDGEVKIRSLGVIRFWLNFIA